MARIHYFTDGGRKIGKRMDRFLSRGKDKWKVFDDFLTMSICALAGGRMEKEYLECAGRYPRAKNEGIGDGLIDEFPRMFGELVNAMEDEKKDIIGDFFMGAVSNGESGQYFTPEHISDFMAQIVGGEGADGEKVADMAGCGSGRMLLGAAKVNPRRLFIGKDLDLRCVKMTALNLALNGLRGFVIWGNGLTNEQLKVYRTGFDGVSFIQEIPPDLHDFFPARKEEEPQSGVSVHAETQTPQEAVCLIQPSLF